MHLGCNPYSHGDNNQIFNDILPRQGQDHESRPGFARQENQRHECRDHVDQQQWDDEPGQFGNQEHDPDQDLECGKQDIERVERYETDGCGE